MPVSSSNSIAIVGGGLAGLAAAEAASRLGFEVELFEQAAQLGGRAGSFVETFNGLSVDFCQHAAMGCCTNFLEFCRRADVADYFRREKTLHFVGPDNIFHRFVPSRWLPAPFHLLAGLKRLEYLTPKDRHGIAQAMKQLARLRDPATSSGSCLGSETVFGNWLAEQNQSENAVKRFWSVVVQGALSETIENVSLSAARKVFVEGFLSARTAGDMILPTLPLAEIFDRRVGDYLSDRSVKIHRRTKVMWIESDENSQLSLVLPEGDAIAFDAIILAAPWHQAGNLFPPELLAELPEISRAQKLPSGTITAVHLWFDRPIMALPHAVLVDKLSQWIFQGVAKKSSEGQDAESTPAYYQVVISAAHRLAKLDKEALLSQVLEDISAAFPDAKNASLLHSRVVVQPNAVFSLQPGVEKHRPSPSTSLANLFLAGDWTATGWPATMEGAVRSGYAAVENLLKSFERSENLVVPDLPRGFFSRRILGG